jgi:hypothetical protein
MHLTQSDLTFGVQSELDRIVRETTEAAARRDALHKSLKDKEQVLPAKTVLCFETFPVVFSSCSALLFS